MPRAVPQLKPGPDIGNALLTGENIKGTRLSNVIRQQQASTFGEDRAAIQAERASKAKTGDLQYKQDLLKWGMDSLRTLAATNPQEYPAWKAKAAEFGFPPTMLPDPATFANAQGQMDVPKFTQWAQQAIAAATGATKEFRPITVAPGGTVIDQAGKVIFTAPKKEPVKTEKKITVSPG